MRLLNLELEDWRGIDSRQVTLSEGVTLIEGPNEIGKSTIVEAVRMLFSELDSSKKKSVKAIQPLGRDVGSGIKAEVKTGNYHFIYAKTYNKATATTLDILAPKKKQLTGRTAHEEVERILDETMDLALWDALLVEQGEKVALANFQDSAGLANALDEAAGSSFGGEDSGLFEAVQREYENYFTLKTGKPKFSGLQDRHSRATAALEEAKRALDAVEQDSRAHERTRDEVQRLNAQLPELKEKLDEHEKTWASVTSLKDRVVAKEKELESARALEKAAADAHKDRTGLVAEIDQGEKSLAKAQSKQTPLRARVDELRDRSKNAQLVINDLRQKVKDSKSALELAQTDEQQVRNLEALAGEEERLGQLEDLSKSLKEELEIAGAIKIDDAALDAFRQAERRLDIATGKRDSAATSVTVTAEKKLDLEIGDAALGLDEGQAEKRSIATEMVLRVPGVVRVQLSPPQSVAELQDEAEDAKAAFANLKQRFDVKDLKEAESLNEKRKSARREIDRLKRREEEILKGASREEIELSVASWQTEYDTYVGQRTAEQPLPESAAEATTRVATAKDDLNSNETSLETARAKAEALKAEFEQVDNELRDAQQALAAIEATLEERRLRLEKARESEADDDSAKRAENASANARKLEQDTEALRDELARTAPDSVEALLTNAKAVHERAGADLRKAEQDLAILSDRLKQAQADGRFESMEAAERELDELDIELSATRRRAAAVELLWTTLNKHRDSARQAYVRPLKEAIERLGAIVFGSEFEVELGDDWSLLSRTLDGKTLPFDDLSVGAKEQMGILTRLAAAQIIAKQGGVPLIIDDALGFSDPSRLETMGAAIAAAGKQCQIIILTCTPGRFMHVGNAEVVRF